MQLVGIVGICILSHFAAYYSLGLVDRTTTVLRKSLIVIGLVISVSIFSGSIALGFLLLLGMCLYTAQYLDHSHRVILFLSLLFAIPDSNAIELRLGLDLGTLSYTKVLILGLLLPLSFSPNKAYRGDKLNVIDYYAIGFIVWTMLRTLEFGDFSTIVRLNFWIVVKLLVPYYVIRFCLKDYKSVLIALSFGLFAQCIVSIFEGAMFWKVYGSFMYLTDFFEGWGGSYKVRHGFLRTEASYGNPLILSLFGNFAFIAAFMIYLASGNEQFGQGKKLIKLGLILVCCAGVFFTGSRAGMAGMVLCALLVSLLLWSSRRRRDPKGLLKFLMFSVILGVIFFGEDYIRQEFAYRYQVFTTCIDVLGSYLENGQFDIFLIGNFDVTLDPRMEALRQGEGIIDLVNVYVVIVLNYGFVGLVLFVTALVKSVSGLYKSLRLQSDDGHLLGIFVLSCILILIFNMSTTSPIGMTYDFMWILLPISANLVSARKYTNNLAFDNSKSVNIGSSALLSSTEN